MKDVIDIYIKVIIAFFGFVAPSFTILISVFLEGIEKKKKIHEEELKQLNKLISENINNNKDAATTLKDTLKKFKAQQEKAQKEVNLLNPIRQVMRVFICLGSSLFFIALYHIARSDFYQSNIFWLKFVVILASVAFFIIAVCILWQLFCVIIETKKLLLTEKNTVKNTVRLKPLKPSEKNERI